MKLRTRVTTLIVAVIAALGLAATPAQALTGYDRCQGWGYVCAFSGLDGSGTMTPIFGSAGRCSNMPASANNTADSFYNKREGGTSHHVQFYDGANCTGELLAVAPADYWTGPFPSGTHRNFTRFRNKGGTDINHRDELSSVFFNTG